MKKIIKTFLSFISIVLVAGAFVIPAFGASNLDTGDVGDFGQWNTDANRELIIGNMTHDTDEFKPKAIQLVKDFVPIEAKIGLVMMQGLTHISNILNSSLVRFAVIFMLLAYVFWGMFEAYKMMSDGGKKAWDLVEEIVKKGLVISFWIIVLRMGPARLFMAVMGPIVAVGTYFADLILTAITNTVGVDLPDTCAAIHAYTAANTPPDMLLDARAAADLMCVPTRMSGFLYTAWNAGWQWIGAGIGNSAFTIVVGATFVVLFTINIYKFALMALGVIADLFLGVFMLPFTAIAETISQTKFNGFAGNIFNSFMGLFRGEKLSKQLDRFINASIYFVSLSIVIGLCTALLSLTIDTNMAADVPTIETDGFWITLLTGCLVLYLATNMDKTIKDLGGSINSSMGTKFGDDIKKLSNNVINKTKEWYKLIKEGA